MKKTINLFLALLCFVYIFAACVNNRQKTTAYTESLISELSNIKSELPQQAYPLQIMLANDTLLNSFTYIHEFDYWHIHMERDFWNTKDFESHTDESIVIWSSVPLRDFAVIRTNDFEFLNDHIFINPVSSHGYVDELLPGQGYVINRYAGVGTIPLSGITFIDENDRRRFFTMQEDQSDEFDYRFRLREMNVSPNWKSLWDAE